MISTSLFRLTAAAATPGDADGLNLDSHPGPAAWIEEHWDVIPDRLADFLNAYDKVVYSLARRTPGYRGYTVATTLPGGKDEPKTECDGGICKSLGALVENGRLGQQGLKGENHAGRLAERAVNWDALLQHAYNVLITHHIQTWADSDRFRARIAAIYAMEHKGGTLEGLLESTLNPLATVYWEASYRLLSTSWPVLDSYTSGVGSKVPADADGLNLEPRQGPLVLVAEYWDVRPENLREFVAAYERDVHNAAVRRVKGYRGYSIATSLPPQKWESHPQPMTRASRKRLGGSDDLYVWRPSVGLDGSVRSDIRINAGALFKKTFTVIVRHQIQTWEVLKAWPRGTDGGGYEEIYERENGGRSINDLWLHGLFTLCENHSDSILRLVKTSFVATASDPAALAAKPRP